MLNPYLILFLLIFLSIRILPQNITDSDSLQTNINKSDILQIFNRSNEIKTYELQLFYDENLKKWNDKVPDYKLRSSNLFSSNNYSFIARSNKSNWIYPENNLE